MKRDKQIGLTEREREAHRLHIKNLVSLGFDGEPGNHCALHLRPKHTAVYGSSLR